MTSRPSCLSLSMSPVPAPFKGCRRVPARFIKQHLRMVVGLLVFLMCQYTSKQVFCPVASPPKHSSSSMFFHC